MRHPPIQEGSVISGAFAADTAEFLRVHRDATGAFAISGATTKSVGVQWSQEPIVVAQDARGSIRLHQTGTTVMVAAGAIAVGAGVFAAANGRVADSGSVSEGVALTAAAQAGDLIEVCHSSAA